MDETQAAALRRPFPKSAIGRLPKGGTMLDYVGHAATTDRLLAVDPAWSWEPFTTDERGLPALDGRGNLWIRLTVCGVTRIGVGDGKSAKEVVGDAIRNAAMRFGVALDLWSKEELEQSHGAVGALEAPAEPPPLKPTASQKTAQISDAQVGKIGAMMSRLHITDRDLALQYVADIIGRQVASRKDLSKQEASQVIDALDRDLAQAPPPVAPPFDPEEPEP
jgi:hypothetical protein